MSLIRRAGGVLALLLLPLAPALAQQDSARVYHPDSSPPKRVAIDGPVEVPLLLLGRAPGVLPVVEVRINGRGPFRFGIETGARFVAAHPRVVDSLGLSRSGGIDESPEYHVDSLSVGDVVFHELPITALKTAAEDIDGILGLPLYSDLLLTIDYPRKVARFERGSLPPANGNDILPLTRVAVFWGFPIALGDRRFTAILDTRSTGGFGLTPASASGVKFDGALEVIGMARGAAIGPTEVKAGRLAGDATIGRYRFPRPSVHVRPLPPLFPTEPIVGSVVLQNFAVTLDQRNARVRFSRSGSPVITLPAPARRPAPPVGQQPATPTPPAKE